MCSWHARDGWMHVNSMWFATTRPINYNDSAGKPNYDAACATTNAEGHFELTTLKRNLLPNKFANPLKSPLSATISADGETDLAFALGD